MNEAMLPDPGPAAPALTEFIRQYHAQHGTNPPECCKRAFLDGYQARPQLRLRPAEYGEPLAAVGLSEDYATAEGKVVAQRVFLQSDSVEVLNLILFRRMVRCLNLLAPVHTVDFPVLARLINDVGVVHPVQK